MMKSIIIVLLTLDIIVTKAESHCTHVIVGNNLLQKNYNTDDIIINVQTIDFLSDIQLQCVKVFIRFNNGTTVDKVMDFMQRNRATKKELNLLHYGNETELIFNYFNGKIFNFDTNFGNLVKCAYSNVDKEIIINGDICKQMPYWKERFLNVLYVKKRITDPMKQRFTSIASAMGFKYNEVGVKKFGGYVKYVAQNKVDLAMQRLLFTNKRYEFVDFLSLGRYHELCWVMPRPKPNYYNANSIIIVFEAHVWLSLGLTLITAFILLALLENYDHQEINWFKIGSLSLTVFISEPVKASWFESSKKSKMVLFFMWIPLAFCLCLTYKANLLVHILAITYDDKIDTTEQVLNSKLPLWIAKDGLIGDLFFKDPSPMMAAVVQENVANGGFYAPPNQAPPLHIKQMRDEGQSIWLAYRSDVKKQIDKYRPSKEAVYRGPLGLGITKHNPLLEKFTVMLMRYNEGALLHLPEGKFDAWPELRIAQQNKIIDEKQPIHFEQIWSCIFILLIGLSVAIFSYLLEKLSATISK